jgi:hypothetical protein
VIREALRAAPDREGNPVRGPLISVAAERTRALTAALRDEMRAGRIEACDPRRVAEHLLHALIGHFVAESIAGTTAPPQPGEDPFLVHLVDTIAGDLERGRQRGASPGRRRTGGGAP